MSDSPIDLSRFSGHTPGPWSWWDSCSFRRLSHQGDGDVLAPVVQRSDGHPDVHFRNGGYTGPDARLIAAAPDLLAEIERLRAEVAALREQYDGIEEERNAMDAVQDRAEAAESALAALRKRFAELEAAAWHGLQASAPTDGESTMLTVTESCKRLIAERDALRKRVEESARAVLQEGPPGRGYVKAHLSRVRNEGVALGVPVALVVLGEG